MVTEQVKRIQAALREAGFKRGGFRVRAEITRERDRTVGRTYSVYGDALGISRGSEVVERVLDGGAERIVEAGLVVEIIRHSDLRPWVAVREPRYLGGRGESVRYEQPRVIERDLDAEIAEGERLRTGSAS